MFSSAFPPDLCAKMTLFQFFEGVTDQLAVQAYGCHPVWQDAISVPLDAADFMPLHLGKFRSEFGNNQLFQKALANAHHELAQTGVLPSSEEVNCTANIVNAVCLMNHLGSLLATMNDALGALAAVYPEWLQQTMLPHWIGRYPWQKRCGLPASLAEQTVFASAVADDILYLLRHFDREMGEKRPFLSEVALLKKVFWSQFTASSQGFIWTPLLFDLCTGALSI